MHTTSKTKTPEESPRTMSSQHHFRSLVQLVKNNRTSGYLRVEFDRTGNGIVEFASALAKNQSVESLSVAYCEIGVKGMAALANTLTSNQCLKALDLLCCGIDDEGATALAGALAENQCLGCLCLGWNKIGARGTMALGDALKKNRSLRDLDLSHNQIEDDGALAIAKALRNNKSLSVLYLGGNKFGDNGAVGLAGMLQYNSVLKCLYLEGNENMTEKSRRALGRAMQHNHVLESLELSDRPSDCPWYKNVEFLTYCNSLHLWNVDENTMIPWHRVFHVLLNGRQVHRCREDQVESYRLSLMYVMLQNRPDLVMRRVRKRPTSR